MTVPNDPSFIVYTGNGVQTVFTYPFIIPYQADGVTPAVKVSVSDNLTDPSTITVLSSSDYAIADVGDEDGGTVTYSPAIPATSQIFIERDLDYMQPSVFLNQGFYPESVETALDYQAETIQQLANKVARTVLVPPGESGNTLPKLSQRAGKFAAWDLSGRMTTAVGMSSVPVSSFMEALLLETSAAAVREYIGAARNSWCDITDPPYNAVGDGVTNNTAKIQSAINTGASYIIVPSGVFLSDHIDLGAGQQLIGLNQLNSILKVRNTSSPSGFIRGTGGNCVVENLTIDGANLIWPINGTALFSCDSDSWRVDKVRFINADRFCIGANSGSRWKVKDIHCLMKQLFSFRIVSFVAGAGGPASTVNNVATVTGGGAPTDPTIVLYDTTAGGAVTNPRVSHHGQGYTSNPTVSFPLVPGSSCVARKAGTQTQAINVASSFAMPTGCEISGSYFLNAGHYLSWANSHCDKNEFVGWVFGSAVASDGVTGAGNNIYDGNLMSYGGLDPNTGIYAPFDTNITNQEGFENGALGEIFTNNIIFRNGGDGISNVSRRCIIDNNEVFDNGQSWLQAGGPYIIPGINLRYVDATFNSTDSIVTNNKVYDSLGAGGTQAYGISIETPLITGLVIEDNDCRGNRIAPYLRSGAVLASFKGRRLANSITWNPVNLAPGAQDGADISFPGLDAAANWKLSAYFTGLTTQKCYLSAWYQAVNLASLRLTNTDSVAVDLPSGLATITAEELIA